MQFTVIKNNTSPVYSHKEQHMHQVTRLNAEFPLHGLMNYFLRMPHVQDIVFEPCSCVQVQLNKAMYPFRLVVDGTASTGDVICRLLGTTVTTK